MPENYPNDMKPERHNVILFGEAGCGKSSIVNMIVGNAVAKVSNGADGCTFKNESYEVDLGETSFRIFDTTGLNEGDQGRVPHWKAIQGLYTLIRQLNGVSLLVYCMRGRIKANAPANWILFHEVICGKQVPIIAAVTGLESEERLDDWWVREENKAAFKRYKMKPRSVGCIVSDRGDRSQHEAKYKESQGNIRDLIQRYHRTVPWSQDKEAWFAQIYKDSYEAGICFFATKRKDFTDEIMKVFDQFVEFSMTQDDLKKLKRCLLKAEQKIREPRKKWFLSA